MKPVEFAVTREVAFDYLSDPANRSQWQSSLARVEQVSGPVGVGQTWVDVTRPGLRPLMETTEWDRPRRWTERGTWRGFAAELTLLFEPRPGGGEGCLVFTEMDLRGPGAFLLRRVAPLAVRGDLVRAARTLSRAG